MGRIQNTFRALQSSNYKIFIAGQAISRIGTWMERTAVSWVVYEMTNSTFMLGLTAFVSQFPSFLFSLYGGILSDKYPRHKIVMITQVASFLQAAILAFIVLSGDTAIWHILTLITLLGIINAFDIPARQSLVHQLLSNPEDLSNAVALNSSVVNLARLIGPAIAGLVLSTLGAGICFSLNALSYLAVIISLLFLKLAPQPKKVKKQSNLSEIKETFSYLKHHPILAPTMIYIAIISLLVIPYNTLLPEFAKEVFQGNAQTYGFMVSSIGLGAFLGTLFLASLAPKTKKSRILIINAAILGSSLIVFSITELLPFALFLAVITGFTGLTQSTICLTIVQTEADAEKRGQLISLYAMALFGMMPLGSLLVGLISNHIGSSTTLLIQGLIAIAIAISFFQFLRKKKLKSMKNTLR
ncbi:MFS transporter [Echinicola strongylocentroti]|uniref:MFS transporter n=1 Tax=Echinicola strongylocentroti TaxID=1795355 RepID=A0A2Z4IDQ6_9BACT|nr:MFS transporter [Echinicola strongylocentroti]AWW28857.1 MFS transporter [Echinicola strongylocentroti]